jgi:hypothetical protein
MVHADSTCKIYLKSVDPFTISYCNLILVLERKKRLEGRGSEVEKVL